MFSLATVTLIVRQYAEAIVFYRDRLGFTLVEDTDLGDGKRWVIVAPPGGTGARLLLAKAEGAEQEAAIGNQGGGRVMFFLETDAFEPTYRRMLNNGVEFLETPRHESYGSVVVFADLYGNKWDLIAPKH